MFSTTPCGGQVFLAQGTLYAEARYSALRESALFEILTAREAIDRKSTELAALHTMDEELEGLRRRLAELGSESCSVDWNCGFHVAIAEASHNTVLYNLHLDVIESRNGDAARDSMHRHIVNTQEAFRARRAECDTEQSSPVYDWARAAT